MLRLARCPIQNADPSPSSAPAIAVASTHSSLSSPPGTSALSARIMVEPGITDPTTGTASSSAARNNVKYASQAFAETNAIRGSMNEATRFLFRRSSSAT